MANNNENYTGARGKNVTTMLCLNDRCPKPNIDQPLELFDGTLACPNCGHILSNVEFEVTEYNDGLFKLSQLYYFNYLTELSQKKLSPKEAENMVSMAISYCRQASRAGHPEARVKLGYYWEMGYMKKSSDANRYKMAYRYYKDVLTMDERRVKIEKDANRKATVSEYESSAKLSEVRRESASRIALMCSNVDIGAITSDIQSKLNEFGLKITKNLDYGEYSVEDSIYNILARCKLKNDAQPVFGYFIVSIGSLRNLYLREKRSLKSIIRSSKKLDVKWIIRDDLFDMGSDNDSFYNLTDSEDSLPSVGKDYPTNDTLVLLYFFNGDYTGKNAKDSKYKKSIKKLKDVLFYKGDRDSEMTDELVYLLSEKERLNEKNGFFERVFYADDVYFACLKNHVNPILAIGEYLTNKEQGEDE
ncbi:MAG: hypothetical protein E7353_05795 [Clostridiales bacterium]|nr:hypothetical protein [Clostridiales bacterium]